MQRAGHDGVRTIDLRLMSRWNLREGMDMNHDTAASDLIAAVALIAVFVTAAAIVGVTVFSSLQGDAPPAMIARNVTEDGKLYIYHDGGDPLERGRFAILVNGVDRTADFNLTDALGDEHDTWTSWGTGQALVLSDDLPEDVHIQITGEGVGRTGSEWLLHDIGEGTPAPTQTVPTPTQTATPTETTTPTQTATPTETATPAPPLVANFTANITTGQAPLAVAFTDTSTGGPVSWSWNFGDGSTSTAQNPVHTYTAAGNYTVTLNVTNAHGYTANLTKEDYIHVTAGSLDFIVDENVFIYGDTLEFDGNTINGPGATAVILGGLRTDDLNGGASIAVSNLYIGGDVNLDGGSASLGSAQNPGSIYVDGNLRLWSGGRNIYGTVYVNGNFDLKDASIHGNVYVNGNLTLGWKPTIADDVRIYYTGTLTAPDNYNQAILAKCIPQATVPGFEMPDWEIPPTKPQTWYTERGYIQNGTLTSDMKVFAPAYSSTSSQHTATNVIIVAYDGDITITGLGGSGVTGVFIAPKGRVTFSGAFLEGVVLTRDGLFVTSGGTTVTFRNLSDLITDPADYPL